MFNLESQLRALEEGRVEYVVIGGVAVGAHGYIRRQSLRALRGPQLNPPGQLTGVLDGVSGWKGWTRSVSIDFGNRLPATVVILETDGRAGSTSAGPRVRASRSPSVLLPTGIAVCYGEGESHRCRCLS